MKDNKNIIVLVLIVGVWMYLAIFGTQTISPAEVTITSAKLEDNILTISGNTEKPGYTYQGYEYSIDAENKLYIKVHYAKSDEGTSEFTESIESNKLDKVTNFYVRGQKYSDIVEFEVSK
ncbi:hypothetical protein RZE82_01540 [Mollicutes bacterium LVI A0039]|nr:hypothetical protein RZE82_01540 [Mollicutes bacterium LVI A0039]